MEYHISGHPTKKQEESEREKLVEYLSFNDKNLQIKLE